MKRHFKSLPSSLFRLLLVVGIPLQAFPVQKAEAGIMPPPVASDQQVTVVQHVPYNYITLGASGGVGPYTFHILSTVGNWTGHGWAFIMVAPDKVEYLSYNIPSSSGGDQSLYNYLGPDSFTYNVCDANNQCSNTATISITMVAPQTPTASNSGVYTKENVPANFTFSAADPNNEGLVYKFTQPTNGTVTGPAADGKTFTFTPNAGSAGSTSLGSFYVIGATSGLKSNTAVTTFSVQPNQHPMAKDINILCEKNTERQITLVATDADNDPLTWTIVMRTTHGFLSGTPPNMTYMPNAGFTGTDTFTYKVNDGTVDSNVATVTITVLVNHPPVANDQTVNADIHTPRQITLVATDPDNNPLTYGMNAYPAHGTLSGTPPNMTYLGDAGFQGTDTFKFAATDGLAVSNVATVTINVAGNDTPLTASDMSVTVVQHVPYDISLKGSGGVPPYTYKILSTVGNWTGHGWAFMETSLVAQYLSYNIPASSGGNATYYNYLGPDSFTYQVCDTTGQCSSAATVSINMVAPTAPKAFDGSVATIEGLAVPFRFSASDPNHEGLGFKYTQPTNGVVSGPANDGTFTFTPNAGSAGTTSAEPFTANGIYSGLQSNPATETYNVIKIQAPIAYDDSITVPEYPTVSNITLKAIDPNNLGFPLTYTLLVQPRHGRLTGTPPLMQYAPANGYAGPDALTFKVNNGHLDSNIATVSITVKPPLANDDTVPATSGNIVSFNVLTNDDHGLTVKGIVTQPTKGFVSLDNATTGTMTYRPMYAWIGSDTFTYQDIDADGHVSNVAKVTITTSLTGAVNDSVSTGTNNPVTIDVMANDASGLVFNSIVQGPTNGTAVFVSPRSIKYTPNQGFNGTDRVLYNDRDLMGNISNVAMVTIDVSQNGNKAPVASDESVTVRANSTASITLPATDDGLPNPPGALTYTIDVQPTHGTLMPPTGNLVSYTPMNGYTGPDSFKFHANDGMDNSNVATVSIQVALQPLQAMDDHANVMAPRPAKVAVLNNDTGGYPPYRVVAVTQPGHGTATINIDQTVTYTPNRTLGMSDQFTYTIRDAMRQTSTAKVKVSVLLAPGARLDGRRFVIPGGQSIPLEFKRPALAAADTMSASGSVQIFVDGVVRARIPYGLDGTASAKFFPSRSKTYYIAAMPDLPADTATIGGSVDSSMLPSAPGMAGAAGDITADMGDSYPVTLTGTGVGDDHIEVVGASDALTQRLINVLDQTGPTQQVVAVTSSGWSGTLDAATNIAPVPATDKMVAGSVMPSGLSPDAVQIWNLTLGTGSSPISVLLSADTATTTVSAGGISAAGTTSGQPMLYELKNGTWEKVAVSSDQNGYTAVIAESGIFAVFHDASTSGDIPVTLAFGNVYAFPNPVHGGQSARLHVEAGAPDEVIVHIYDEAGDRMGEIRQDEPPMLVQGNWANELTVDTSHLGSGIYYAVVTAKRAGFPPIVKKVRFAVIK